MYFLIVYLFLSGEQNEKYGDLNVRCTTLHLNDDYFQITGIVPFLIKQFNLKITSTCSTSQPLNYYLQRDLQPLYREIPIIVCFHS